MKANVRKNRRVGRGLAIALLGALLIAALAGVGVGFGTLRRLWREPCLLVSPAEQVTVNAGRMVTKDAIAEAFGLRAGVNLAEIDFAACRTEILARIPNIRDITVTRDLPDRVRIDVVERTPAVRLGIVGQRRDTGRVADADGVVFCCRRDTATLPVIREPAAAVSAPGTRLTGRGLAALRLTEACGERAYLDLGLLEVDVSKPDFLVATLGNYARAKIAWEGMDTGGALADGPMREQLQNLLAAVRARIGGETAVWNATMPNRVFADTKESLK